MIGPKVTTQRSCFDCEACVSESYRVQSDSGQNIYCTHPQLAERRRIGYTNWETPDWCPASIAAAPQFIAPEITDEMCERVEKRWRRSPFDKSADVGIQATKDWLTEWRAELGPQLGLVELREPSDAECAAISHEFYGDIPVNVPHIAGAHMFDAVAKWLKGEL